MGNTNISYPTGTMVRHNGVDVDDDYSALNFQGEVKEDPNKTIKITPETYQKNGTVLSEKQPSVLNYVTNKDIVETPSGSIQITDEIIKKSGSTVLTGPNKYNFFGDVLIIEDPNNAGQVIVNLAGPGFFGDASDGDYTLDGNQGSVAGLFTYGGATSPINITSIVAATDAAIISAIQESSPTIAGYGTVNFDYLKTATNIDSFATNALVKATAHGLSSNDSVLISGFTALNGIYEIIVVTSDYFILRDSTMSGTYTSGATVKKLESYTLLRDAFFNNLILTNVRLITANFRLFARTCTGTGRICNSGDVATAGTGYFPTPEAGTAGGTGGTTNLPGPDAQGGTQGTASSAITTSLFDNSFSPTNGQGARGGDGDDNSVGEYFGGPGGAERNPASTSRPTDTFRGRFNLITGVSLSTSTLYKFTGYSGSCGGGGGGAGAFESINYPSGVGGNGGHGGNNGGIMLIAIRYITGTIKIKSNGSVGTNGAVGTAGAMNYSTRTPSPSGGGGGGGGGGSGGAIFFFYQVKSSTIMTEARGGDGGRGGGKLRNIIDPYYLQSFSESGFSGLIGNPGLIEEYQIT